MHTGTIQSNEIRHTQSGSLKTGWRGFNPYGSGQNCFPVALMASDPSDPGETPGGVKESGVVGLKTAPKQFKFNFKTRSS